MPVDPEEIKNIDNPPFPIQVWSKAQLANSYGVSDKTLKKWLDECGIETGYCRKLAIAQIKILFEQKGYPSIKPSYQNRPDND